MSIPNPLKGSPQISAVIPTAQCPDGTGQTLQCDVNGNLLITSSSANIATLDAATGANTATAPLFSIQIAAQDVNGKLQAVSPTNPLPTTGGGAGGGTSITNYALETGGNLASVKTNTDKIPALGQALAAASVPIVLTAAQITTLTPPAAITNFANETGGNLATIATRTPALGQALAAASVPVVLTAAQITSLTPPAAFNGVVTNAGTFATQATLAAETTKVIGTVNIASAQTVGLVAGSAVIGHVIADSGSTTVVTGNVASTVADGANVTLGTKADAKNSATDTTAVSMISVLKQISASVQAPPSQAVTNAGTFAVQATATLAAETTKVIGTVNQGTSPWVTSSTLAAETTKVIGTVNVAASQTIAVTNTGTFATQSTLAAETTKVIGTVNIASSQTVGLVAGSAVIGHVINDASSAVIGHVIVDTAPSTAVTNVGTFAVQATLAAETTKVIGTVNVASAQTIAVTNAGTFAVQAAAPTLTKGTQGSTGFSVQDLKDSGRTYVTFTALAAAGVTSEALLSFSKNAQGTATAAVTSYQITSGKTLRITSIAFSLKSAAAAIAFGRLVLRHNTAGATTASSAAVYVTPEVNTNSATSGTSAWVSCDIPDGIEFFGNGTQTIGVSHLDQATTNVLNVTVSGYEY